MEGLGKAITTLKTQLETLEERQRVHQERRRLAIDILQPSKPAIEVLQTVPDAKKVEVKKNEVKKVEFKKSEEKKAGEKSNEGQGMLKTKAECRVVLQTLDVKKAGGKKVDERWWFGFRPKHVSEYGGRRPKNERWSCLSGDGVCGCGTVICCDFCEFNSKRFKIFFFV